MWGGCWGRCGDADACVLFIFDLLTRAADQSVLLGSGDVMPKQPDKTTSSKKSSVNDI